MYNKTMDINKIINADSYEYIKTMPDKCVDLIICDPPYEINHTAGGGRLIDRGIDIEERWCYGL